MKLNSYSIKCCRCSVLFESTNKKKKVCSKCFESSSGFVCEKCNKSHDKGYGSGRFCSQKCARSFASFEKREEINRKVSIAFTGRFRNSNLKLNRENDSRFVLVNGVYKRRQVAKRKNLCLGCLVPCVRKRCRNCGTKYGIQKTIQTGKHKGWLTRNKTSFAEEIFKGWLTKYHVEFEHNKPVSKKELGLDCGYSLFLDFYLPRHNVNLEIDGQQHKRSKDKDAERDLILESNGIRIFRISWSHKEFLNGGMFFKFFLFLKYLERDVVKVL